MRLQQPNLVDPKLHSCLLGLKSPLPNNVELSPGWAQTQPINNPSLDFQDPNYRERLQAGQVHGILIEMTLRKLLLCVIQLIF